MDIDFKLDKVIEIFDLVKRMSLGAIPLWFSLTLPVIYIAYKKLLPVQNPVSINPEVTTVPNAAPVAAPVTFMQRIKKLLALPKMDTIIIYTSLALFVIGTITLYIDQRYREKIRNNGLRMKQYLVAENIYTFSKDSLSQYIHKLSIKNIDQVLWQHPTEFIQTKNNWVVLMDSVPMSKIIISSEKLLDSYLGKIKPDSSVSIDRLFNTHCFFTRRIIYKLITDSSFKYRFTVDSSGLQGIARK